MERLLPQIPIPNELMWMIDGQDRKRATKLITDYVALCAEEQDKDLKNWVVRCRDDVLYPLAHQPTEIGRRAEILGSQTVALLTPNAKVTGSPALSASPRGLPGYATGDKHE